MARNRHPYGSLHAAVPGISKACCDDDRHPAELLALQSMRVLHKLEPQAEVLRKWLAHITVIHADGLLDAPQHTGVICHKL